jgi:hypothetical protein
MATKCENQIRDGGRCRFNVTCTDSQPALHALARFTSVDHPISRLPPSGYSKFARIIEDENQSNPTDGPVYLDPNYGFLSTL